jgi:hypothetical protein
MNNPGYKHLTEILAFKQKFDYIFLIVSVQFLRGNAMTGFLTMKY